MKRDGAASFLTFQRMVDWGNGDQGRTGRAESPGGVGWTGSLQGRAGPHQGGKKNPSTPNLHLKCILTSDSMPKIQPQTIKSLKTKPPSEGADIFNVSKRQVERIRK
ncbi:hypothetical protein QQF64_009547 [Cirrhinus molitorella]|uniref:Uncharacterized protein n=1 Tax=Cirrhinus molitorella TaxID=172907 RepID=A0ABR3M2Z6_9TELE